MRTMVALAAATVAVAVTACEPVSPGGAGPGGGDGAVVSAFSFSRHQGVEARYAECATPTGDRFRVGVSAEVEAQLQEGDPCPDGPREPMPQDAYPELYEELQQRLPYGGGNPSHLRRVADHRQGGGTAVGPGVPTAEMGRPPVSNTLTPHSRAHPNIVRSAIVNVASPTTALPTAPPKEIGARRGTERVNRARVRTDTEDHAALRVRRIPVGRCRLHRYNQFRDIGDLRGLAVSIRTQGLEQPITVQEHDGWYEVVDGVRRFLAVQQLLERRTIAAYVRAPRPNDEVLAATIATDIHKRPMTQAERGNVVRLLQEADWNVADLAAYWGVAESTIYTWISQARAHDATSDDAAAEQNTDRGSAASETQTLGVSTTRTTPSPVGQRGTPKWKASVGELRRRWESQLGEHGLTREQASALLAELAMLAGDTGRTTL